MIERLAREFPVAGGRGRGAAREIGAATSLSVTWGSSHARRYAMTAHVDVLTG